MNATVVDATPVREMGRRTARAIVVLVERGGTGALEELEGRPR